MNWQKRRYCGELRKKDIESTVYLSGWVDTIRDHGQILFIHLRDVKGFVQIVFDPAKDKGVHAIGNSLHNEYTVSVEGTVVERSSEAKNSNIPTGDIEIHVTQIELHSKSKVPPFTVTEKSQVGEDPHAFNVDEDLRMTYRYLDLRRPSMQEKLITRHHITRTIRNYLYADNFIDVETPMLTKSTPEGARDYLVPSRHHAHHFYALPQSPQLFKQLLMMSGLDRYFQIVKCFRDEDLRPNRQPEFTQLDIEASFIDEPFIHQLIEGLLKEVFQLKQFDLPTPFPHITYEKSMDLYGCDRPDLRFDMQLINVTSILKNTGYKIFNMIANNHGLIKGINVKGKSSEMSKNYLQEDLAKKLIPSFGGKGMSWMKIENGQLVSNIVQFFSEEEKTALIAAMKAEESDVLLFVADTNHALVNDICGRLRLHVGEKFGFIPKNTFAPCWVTEFPLFEEKEGHITSIHHPFTAPSEDVLNITEKEALLKVNSRGYDVVINGEEIGGGSIRIHQADVQQRIFELLGLTKKEIDAKFGWFVNALNYGAPPHGGIALGIDRLTCMLTQTDSIREVIAFPKNRVAYCPLTQAPSPVSEDQLEELHVKLVPLPEKE